MTTITDKGFQRTRLDERVAALVDEMRDIFGESIDISPDSIDGQTLGIFAEAVSNLDMLAENVYHSLNPQSATGAALSRLVQLNGIRRQAGMPSTVVLSLVGTAGTLVPAGSRARTVGGQVFVTLADLTIPNTCTAGVPSQSVDIGPVVAPAGTITEIDTPIYGWASVTNVLDAEIGRLEETDTALRIRRRASVAAPGQSILDSIYAGIANLPGVIQAIVLENPENTVDANGLPPHSIYAVVNGGDSQAIANMIWLKKTAGATLYGSVTEVVFDSIGNPHTVKFSRPTPVNIYVTITLTTRAGWPTDGDARIKAAIVAWAQEGQQIGEEVIFSRLFEPVNSVPGSSVSSMFIGTAPAPSGTANISIGFDSLAAFDTARIVVNVL